MNAGDTLALVVDNGVPEQLGATATVDAGGLTGGTDPEDLETFRARVLYRKRNPPQGGSAPDYVEWAGQALSTVKAVFVDSFANDTRSVWVCFTVSDQANGIPSTDQVATVQAYVSDPVRRPITARVFATGPTEVDVPIALAELRAGHARHPRGRAGRDHRRCNPTRCNPPHPRSPSPSTSSRSRRRSTGPRA